MKGIASSWWVPFIFRSCKREISEEPPSLDSLGRAAEPHRSFLLDLVVGLQQNPTPCCQPPPGATCFGTLTKHSGVNGENMGMFCFDDLVLFLKGLIVF